MGQLPTQSKRFAFVMRGEISCRFEASRSRLSCVPVTALSQSGFTWNVAAAIVLHGDTCPLVAGIRGLG
jgi:hypothetical protein